MFRKVATPGQSFASINWNLNQHNLLSCFGQNAFVGEPHLVAMKEQSTKFYRPLMKRFSRTVIAALGITVVSFTFSPVARAQTNGGSSSTQQPDAPSSYSGASSMRSGSQGGGYSSSQSPYMGSVPEGTATSQVLPLTFKEAIDRGLRNNLGVLLVSDSTLAARGEKWKELGALLPNVSGSVSENVDRINLATL